MFEEETLKTGHSDVKIVRKLPKKSKILTSAEAALLLDLAQPSRNVASVSYNFSQEPQPE